MWWENLLKRLPSWLIAGALIALFVLLLVSLRAGETFGLRLQARNYQIGFFKPEDKAAECGQTQYWYGYYRDILRSTNAVHTIKDDFELKFCSDHIVKGTSHGSMPTGSGRDVSKRWKYQGHVLDRGDMVFEYITDVSPQSSGTAGIGVLYLRQVPDFQDIYEGHWEGLDLASTGVVTRCPYVLMQENLTTQEAEQKMPSLLSTGQCDDQKFLPPG